MFGLQSAYGTQLMGKPFVSGIVSDLTQQQCGAVAVSYMAQSTTSSSLGSSQYDYSSDVEGQAWPVYPTIKA